MVSSTQRFRDNLSRVFVTARRGTDGDDGDGVSLFPRTRNEFLRERTPPRFRQHLKYLKFSAADAVHLFRPVRIASSSRETSAASCLLARSIVLLNRLLVAQECEMSAMSRVM